MVEARIDKRFDFAKRHFKGLFDTLNAASAIFRARQLVDDIKEMRLIISASAHQDPWYRFEFPNYYIVGFVTCLEWHARSRLHDLLRYDPKNFTSDDIKQAVSGSKLEQLLQEQLTVAQLVAASTLVSDFHKYIGIFDRLLEYLGAKEGASDIIKLDTTNPGEFFSKLEGLFPRRHLLVHEIDETQIGGWNVRESASLDEVEDLGQAVIDIMNRLERSIAKYAKGDFPNLLYSETQKFDQNYFRK